MPNHVGCFVVPGVSFPAKELRQLIVAVVFFALGLANISAAPHALGHVLVKFKEVETRNRLGGNGDPLLGLTRLLQLPAGARLEMPIVGSLIKKKPAGAKGEEKLALDSFFYLYLPPGMTVEQCIQRLQKHP